MNEFGEPNMGNPSVRFDEGRESVGHWPLGLSIHPLPPTLRKRRGPGVNREKREISGKGNKNGDFNRRWEGIDADFNRNKRSRDEGQARQVGGTRRTGYGDPFGGGSPFFSGGGVAGWRSALSASSSLLEI